MKQFAFRRGWLFVVIGVCCTLYTTVVYANDADSVSSRIRKLKRVTVSAERATQNISAPMPTQTITSSTMQNLGLQSLADAARRLPGVTVKDYGGLGGLKTVSVRGLGAEHTAVLYDGVMVSNCQAGQIDIGRFNMDDVETLTLSVGQQNDLLQSARSYASAGVLSLKTKNPLEGTDKPFELKARMKGGSYGMINPSVSWAQRIGATTTFSLTGNMTRADGQYPFTLVNGKRISEEKRYNSDVLSWYAEGNLYQKFKDGSRLNTKIHYYDSERGLPGSVILYNNMSNERLWDKNAFVQTRYQKAFSEKWRIQAEGKYNYSWTKYEDTNVKYQGGKKTDVNKQQEYYLSAAALWMPIDGLSVSWSNDAALNTLQNNFPENQEPYRWTWLSALNARWKWKWFMLSGTLVSTVVDEHVKSGNKPADKRRLSPCFSLAYQPFLSNDLFFRVMYKETFRVPSFNDMYYEQTGNTALRPENAHEYNFGITWKSKPWRFVESMMFTADAYYNKVDDKIVALPSMYVWRMMNYGRVDITGVDISLQSRINVADIVGLSLSGVYSLQRALDMTEQSSKTYKHQIPYTPKHSGNVAIQVENPWVNIGYSVVLVGDRYCMRQNTSANLVHGYNEHTLSLSKTFDLKTCSIRLQADVANLTDTQYDVIKYYPMPGRSYRGIVEVKF